jgi:hypothetical protein
MSTLYEKVLEPYIHQCDKHDLAPDSTTYATEIVNSMPQHEFLYALSNALDELLAERKDK